MPTLAFKYRVLRVTSGQELLAREMEGAHQLYNDLVAIERRRRRAKLAFWAERGGFVELLTALDETEIALRDRSRSKEERKPLRKRAEELHLQALDAQRKAELEYFATHEDPAVARRKQRARELRKEYRARDEALDPKTLGALLDADPTCVSERDRLRMGVASDSAKRGVTVSAKKVKTLQRAAGVLPPDDHIDVGAKAEAYAAYKARGVTHGTRGFVADAFERASKDSVPWPPRFRRRETARCSCGVSQVVKGYLSNVYADHTQVRVRKLEDRGNIRQESRRSGRRALVRVRLGSEQKTRGPVFVDLETIMHRPLPDGAVVRQARIVSRPLGLRDEMHVVLTCLVPDRVNGRTSTGRGTVAVDLGWRSLGDDRYRVGYFADDHGEHGQIELPTFTPRRRRSAKFAADGKRDVPIASRREHARDLQEMCDRLFGMRRDELVQALGEMKELPDWLADALRTMTHWRSQSRFARLIEHWGEHRFPGDEAVFEHMEKWLRTWRHNYHWAACEREKAIAARNEHYWNMARKLATTYATIIVSDTDFARARKRKGADETDALVMVDDKSRSAAQFVAPGEFRTALKRAAAKYGCRFVLRAPDTATCHACGDGCLFDRRRSISHACEHCGAVWDQDHNSALNMLAPRDRERSGDGEKARPARKGEKRSGSKAMHDVATPDAAQ